MNQEAIPSTDQPADGSKGLAGTAARLETVKRHRSAAFARLHDVEDELRKLLLTINRARALADSLALSLPAHKGLAQLRNLLVVPVAHPDQCELDGEEQ